MTERPIKIGFTALLKLACLTRRQRQAALLQRLKSHGAGYDFHKRTCGFCSGLASGIPIEELLETIRVITYEAERKSIMRGVTRLSQWLNDNPGSYYRISPLTMTSPDTLFSVQFAPEFGLERAGVRTGYHLWNTKWPDLDPDARAACLCLLVREYRKAGVQDNFEVLSLISGKAYACDMEDVRVQRLADDLTAGIEHMIRRARRELILPGRQPAHPGAPTLH